MTLIFHRVTRAVTRTKGGKGELKKKSRNSLNDDCQPVIKPPFTTFAQSCAVALRYIKDQGYQHVEQATRMTGPIQSLSVLLSQPFLPRLDIFDSAQT